MDKFKNFALKSPFFFGITLLVLYAALTTISYPLHYLFPENEAGQLFGDAAAKLVVFLFFLGFLWRFGWVSMSGITRLSKFRIWPLIAGLLIYCVLARVYAFTGSLAVAFPDSQLEIAKLVLSFSTGLVEETMVRGLVLVTMIVAWGGTKRGQLKAILLSSLLFGLIHLFNIMIRPLGVVLMQALIVTLPGIFYAAFVLTYRSLWPVIVIHWLGNAAVNIKLTGIENYQETFAMWILYGITLIPLVVYSVYLIRSLPQIDEIVMMDADKPLVARVEAI